MKKLFIASWTVALGLVANAADMLAGTQTVTNSTTNSIASSIGDGTGTCIAARIVGDGTGTCIMARTKSDLVQLERLKHSLRNKSVEERELILIKLEEILNDENSN